MSVDLGGFDPNKITPQGSLEALPAGKYKCVVTESERKMTKSGEGAYLQLKMQVIEGDHKGRILFDRLNLWNKNQQAAIIASESLSALCHAMGHLKTVSKSSDLHDKPFQCEVVCKEYQGRTVNEIKGYVWKKADDDTSNEPEPQEKAPWM